MIRALLSIFVLTMVLSAPVPAFAADTPTLQQRLERTGTVAFPGASRPALPVVVGKIISYGLSLLGILFVALMVYGGYLWMNARGNEQQVEKAKTLITSAVIGLAIALSAYTISYFVVNSLTEATGGSGSGGGSFVPSLNDPVAHVLNVVQE